jgi:hypothetical protein
MFPAISKAPPLSTQPAETPPASIRSPTQENISKLSIQTTEKHLECSNHGNPISSDDFTFRYEFGFRDFLHQRSVH